MSRRQLIYCTLSTLLLVFLLLQRYALLQARHEHEVRRAEHQEIERLEKEHEELEQLKAQTGQLEASRLANRELPGLRNEVRQLRQQQAELETLRGQNQQLRSQLNTTNRGSKRLLKTETSTLP